MHRPRTSLAWLDIVIGLMIYRTAETDPALCAFGACFDLQPRQLFSDVSDFRASCRCGRTRGRRSRRSRQSPQCAANRQGSGSRLGAMPDRQQPGHPSVAGHSCIFVVVTVVVADCPPLRRFGTDRQDVGRARVLEAPPLSLLAKEWHTDGDRIGYGSCLPASVFEHRAYSLFHGRGDQV